MDLNSLAAAIAAAKRLNSVKNRQEACDSETTSQKPCSTPATTHGASFEPGKWSWKREFQKSKFLAAVSQEWYYMY